MKLDPQSDPAIEALGQHIITSVLESPTDFSDHTTEGVEYEYSGWKIERIDTDGTTIEVEATQETSEAEKVSNATYNPPSKAHPAEYEHYDVEIIATARIDWSEYHLAGDASLVIEQRGGVPPAPDPEPEWREI